MWREPIRIKILIDWNPKDFARLENGKDGVRINDAVRLKQLSENRPESSHLGGFLIDLN
jgi:hypothetical protein